MAELDLDAIKTRADAAHGCTSDPCGSPVCQTQRDRAALVAEVERLRGKLGEAWREGFSAGYADGTDTGPTSPDNPYGREQP